MKYSFYNILSVCLIIWISSGNQISAHQYDGEQFYKESKNYNTSVEVSNLLHDDPDAAYLLLEELIENCNIKNDFPGLTYSYILKSYLFKESSIANNDSAFIALEKALVIANENNLDQLLAQVHNDFGPLFVFENKLDSAIFHLTVGKKIAIENKFAHLHLIAVDRLSSIYHLLNKNIIAESLIEQALKLYDNSLIQEFQKSKLKLELLEYKIVLKKYQEANELILALKKEFDNVTNPYWTYKLAIMEARLLFTTNSNKESLILLDRIYPELEKRNYWKLSSELFLLKHLNYVNIGEKESMIYNAIQSKEVFLNLNFLQGKAIALFLNAEANYLNENCALCMAEIELISSEELMAGLSVKQLKQLLSYSESCDLKQNLKQTLIEKEILGILSQKDSTKLQMVISVHDIEEILALKHNESQRTKLELEKSRLQNYLMASLFGIVLFLFILIIISRAKSLKRMVLDKEKLTEKLGDLELAVIEKTELLKKIKSVQPNLDQNIESLSELALEGNWISLIGQFKLVHRSFLEKLDEIAIKKLTKTDERLAILIKLKLSNKEIIDLLNITESGLKSAKSRLKTKLNLQIDTYLSTFIREIT
jgi:DNA-binding CsgD family transcriptional regulator